MRIGIKSTKHEIRGITSIAGTCPYLALFYLDSLLHPIMLFYIYILNAHCLMARPLELSNAVVSCVWSSAHVVDTLHIVLLDSLEYDDSYF